MSTGGYYLTTLYASLYYISSFRPRLAARQLSVEAQNSLNQWHRRRTLHCNQSRRSKHRRTIRRPLGQGRGAANSELERGSKEESGARISETETGSKEESLKECDSVGAGATQQQRGNTDGEAEDESQTSTERRTVCEGDLGGL